MIAEDEGRSSHLLFTLHVYQYRIEKQENKAGLPGGNLTLSLRNSNKFKGKSKLTAPELF